MSPEKRKRVLAVSLVVLGAVLGLRILLPALGAGGGGAVEAFTRRGSDSEAQLPELVPLELAALENKPGEFQIGRDPFRFYVEPKPPPPAPPPPPPRPTPAPQPTQSSRPAQPRAPQPPAVDVTYIGSFGPDRGRIAVFTDGTDLYNARIGDVVKTHFVVEAIGYESADLRFVNFPDAPAQRLEAGG